MESDLRTASNYLLMKRYIFFLLLLFVSLATSAQNLNDSLKNEAFFSQLGRIKGRILREIDCG